MGGWDGDGDGGVVAGGWAAGDKAADGGVGNSGSGEVPAGFAAGTSAPGVGADPSDELMAYFMNIFCSSGWLREDCSHG